MDLVRCLYATQFISIIVLGLATGAYAQQPSHEGLTITSITFEPSAQPLEKSVLDTLVPFRVGEAFHTAKAREAIEKLHATGRYEDIQIDAEPSASGVSLRL